MSFSTLKNCSWYEEGKKLLDCNKLHLGTAEGSITYLRAGNTGKSFSCTSLQRNKEPPQKHLPEVTSVCPLPLFVPCCTSHPYPTCRKVSPFPRNLRTLLFEAELIGLALCFLPQPTSNSSLQGEKGDSQRSELCCLGIQLHIPLWSIQAVCFRQEFKVVHMCQTYSGCNSSTV